MARKENKTASTKLFLPNIKGYWLPTILCPLFMIGEVVLEVYIPMFMAYTINYIQAGSIPSSGIVSIIMNNIISSGADSMSLVLTMGAIMVGVSLLSLLCGMGAARVASVAGVGFAMNIRRKVFYKIQDFSFLNIDKFSTASLVTRCTTDITNVQNTFMQIIRMLVRAPLMFIMATIMAFSIHKELALIFVVAVPVLCTVMAIVMSKAFPRFQRMLKSFDSMNAGVQENLIGIRVVKSYVREDYEKEKFLKKADEVMNAQISAEKLMVIMMPLMQLIMYACKLSIIGIGGNFILDGTLLVGDLSAMITYSVQILNSLLMVAMVTISFVITRASITRLNEVMQEDIDIKSTDSDLTVSNGDISFENVNFSYSKNSDNNILSNINLSIKSGETVGIIGGTGEGKSTLVQLIPRLYDVSSGQVKVGGHNVKDYSLTELRDNVSMVLQKNVLFSGTIKDNLKWGNLNATDEQIVEACKCAQAHDFIMSFPKGYDTDLGQGGVNVSGGQKQRLCIARALLKRPKILILDDSTSAVDTATDEKIRKAFATQIYDTTKIIIAQRIASVCDADKIVVIENGKIVDVGSHKELIDRCTIYQEVYQSQTQGVN